MPVPRRADRIARPPTSLGDASAAVSSEQTQRSTLQLSADSHAVNTSGLNTGGLDSNAEAFDCSSPAAKKLKLEPVDNWATRVLGQGGPMFVNEGAQFRKHIAALCCVCSSASSYASSCGPNCIGTGMG